MNCFRKTRSLLVEALLQRGKLELRLLRFVAHQRCVELCGRFELGAYCIKSSLPFSLVWRQGHALQGGQRCGYPFGQIVRNRDVFPDGMLQVAGNRSEAHTSELQSLMRISYAVFCLKKKHK